MNNVIEIKNLTKRYGDLVALDHFNLTVKEGEILGLLGPNGSGKSTCINTILSLLNFDEGELNVKENIDYFCGLYIKDKAIRQQYVEDAIALVGLEEFKKFKPKQLSGGLLRRLNIACGIAHKPHLIFLDEPTVAVDPQSRNHILEGIKILNENGATIVYTTHYMEEVEQLCHEIVIMDKGKVIAHGTNDDLKNQIQLGERVTLVVEKDEIDLIEELRQNPEILSVEQIQNTIHISYCTKENNLGKLIDVLREHHIQYNSVFSERPTLNDVFLELTGKELRD